jgi:hypothetical protein
MPGRIAWIGAFASTRFQIHSSAGGEAINAQVCKTCIRGSIPARRSRFDEETGRTLDRRLQSFSSFCIC